MFTFLNRALPLCFCFCLSIAPPAPALEYGGENLDGKRIDARAFYQGTGGLYRVGVEFNGSRATLYFEDGGSTTIYLRRSRVAAGEKLEGVGRPGYWPVGAGFSLGLENSDRAAGSVNPAGPDLWILDLDLEAPGGAHPPGRGEDFHRPLASNGEDL